MRPSQHDSSSPAAQLHERSPQHGSPRPTAPASAPAAPVQREAPAGVRTVGPGLSGGAVDNKSLAIGVLSITACILLVGVVLIARTPPAAYAIGMNDRAGDYLMVTQQLSISQEGLVIIDAAAEQMIVYSYNINQKALVILARVPLDRLRRPVEQEPQTPGRQQRRRP